MQVLLFEKKKEQHMNVVSALGIRNDLMAGEESEEEDLGPSSLTLANVPEDAGD